jgi:hypothetical protein
MIGAVACLLVWVIGVPAGWGFAEMLIGSMWALLGGNLLAYALKKKKKEDK